MADSVLETIINEILQGVVGDLNPKIGSAIHNAGYDPFRDVASGSASIGVASVGYSVSNLVGIASLQFQDLVASNLQMNGNKLTGQLTFHAVMKSPLNMDVSGEVRLLLTHIGLTGSARISGASVSGTTGLTAMIGDQLCLTDIDNIKADFNYSDASIWINDLGPLNYLLKPIESLILDAAKGAIRSLISSKISDVLATQIRQLLPQCAPLA